MIYLMVICELVIGYILTDSSKTLLSLIQIHNITNIISSELINGIIVIVIVVLAMFIVLYIINYMKSKIWMYYFGTLFIIASLIFMNILGLLYR